MTATMMTFVPLKCDYPLFTDEFDPRKDADVFDLSPNLERADLSMITKIRKPSPTQMREELDRAFRQAFGPVTPTVYADEDFEDDDDDEDFDDDDDDDFDDDDFDDEDDDWDDDEDEDEDEEDDDFDDDEDDDWDDDEDEDEEDDE